MGDLSKTVEVNDYNQSSVVEKIRNLAEFLVYSEKFGKNYFE